MSDVIDQALGKVVDDLERARRLVGEAMKKLFHTFDGLRLHLARERERYQNAINAISGSDGEKGMVTVIQEVLTKFVEDIVNLSRSSVRILIEVDALRSRAEQVASRGVRIEKIAQTTRVVALNARIEAQRVGTTGAAFHVVADEIKALAVESGDLSKAIRQAIAAQAVSLDVTRKAASELAATDLDLAVASNKRFEDTIANLNQVATASSTALDHIQRDIDSAMQALQFEDMLDQLLAAISKKVTAIRTAQRTGTTPDMELVLRAEIDRDVVTQHNVDAGSVDLF